MGRREYAQNFKGKEQKISLGVTAVKKIESHIFYSNFFFLFFFLSFNLFPFISSSYFIFFMFLFIYMHKNPINMYVCMYVYHKWGGGNSQPIDVKSERPLKNVKSVKYSAYCKK